MPEEVRADLRPLMSVLASRADSQLPADSTAIPRHLHGLRLLLVGQHSVLREKTKVNAGKKQLSLS